MSQQDILPEGKLRCYLYRRSITISNYLYMMINEVQRICKEIERDALGCIFLFTYFDSVAQQQRQVYCICISLVSYFYHVERRGVC